MTTMSRTSMRFVFLSAAFALLMLHGCSQDSANQAAETGQPAGLVAGMDRVFSHYEQMRALLANDSLEGLSEGATQLAVAARDVAAVTSGQLRTELESLGTAADRLREPSLANIEEARSAFSGVSQALVEVVVAEPSLATGRYVFECPMTTGFNKWVQVNSGISNPYMGREMPTCGAASRWTE